MFKQHSLILNLNEIMEEYVGGEEETTPELQTVVIQEKRAKTRTEIEQQPEESIKRKRVEERIEIEQGKDGSRRHGVR